MASDALHRSPDCERAKDGLVIKTRAGASVGRISVAKNAEAAVALDIDPASDVDRRYFLALAPAALRSSPGGE